MSSRLSVAAFTALVAVVAAAGVAEPSARADRPPRTPAPSVPDVTSTQPFDPAGWTPLGSATLSARKTRALVTVTGGRATIDQLVLVVDGDLDLSGVTVVTSGGKRLVRGAQHHFWASAPSKQIELAGNKAAVRSVLVLYKLATGTAKLTVYGRASASATPPAAAAKRDEAPVEQIKLAADTTDTGPRFSAREGWTLLGAQTVDGKRDTDVVRVPTSVVGMFTQIAVVVSGGALELQALKLRFAGGSTADIDHRYYFGGSDRSRIISVPGGDASVVRVIQLRYGKERGAGKTRVELWAR